MLLCGTKLINCPVKTYLSAMKNRQKNPAKTTGNRYSIGILMSRTQRRKGLSAASLILKTLDDNPYGNSSKGYWANAECIMHHAATNEKLRAAGYPCLMDYYVRLHIR